MVQDEGSEKMWIQNDIGHIINSDSIREIGLSRGHNIGGKELIYYVFAYGVGLHPDFKDEHRILVHHKTYDECMRAIKLIASGLEHGKLFVSLEKLYEPSSIARLLNAKIGDCNEID